MSEPKHPQTFQLTLRSERSEVPAMVRLRRAMKTLLRSYGLRAVRIEPEKQTCRE
jgi:hypothetical protein